LYLKNKRLKSKYLQVETSAVIEVEYKSYCTLEKEGKNYWNHVIIYTVAVPCLPGRYWKKASATTCIAVNIKVLVQVNEL
jgi:hypothetical protein